MDERVWAAIVRGFRRGTLTSVAGVLLLLATRSSFPVQGIGNPDIAGILYEADLIRAGDVPFVDALDMKPPGTFFLIAGVFAAFSRSFVAVKIVYALWCLLAAPALWLSARALYGLRSTAGCAVLLYLVAIGPFDLNYSSWMATAYAWAFACLVVAIRGKSSWLHVAAGACAAIAFVLKGQAILIAPVFVLVWIWGRWRGEPGARWGAWPLWIAGAALGLAPLVIWFARHRAAGALFGALLPISDASAYAARAQLERGWWLQLWRIPYQEIKAFPLQALLVGAVAIGLWRSQRGPPTEASRAPVAPAAIFFALSVVACGIGGLRFYVHYLPQVLPGLTLLAVHPALAWWRGRPRVGLVGAIMFLGAGVLGRIALGQAVFVDISPTRDALEAGDYIRSRTGPDDTILVWGWAAWPTYFYAERRSPSVVFKVLGQVTEYNDAGMFSPTATAPFKPGPVADRLLQDFRAKPPAYFVHADVFFPSAKEDPLDAFTDLERIIDSDYRLVETFGKITLYERAPRKRTAP